MFAVIFEFAPRPERRDAYFELARLLRPELERIEGFRENNRYRSLTRDGLLLSLSFWQDEKAVIRWRTHAGHHAAQVEGRQHILAHYRLRVGDVVALHDANSTRPLTGQRFDATVTGDAKAVLVRLGSDGTVPSEGFPGTPLGEDRFTGVVAPENWAHLAGYSDPAMAASALPAQAQAGERWVQLRIIRDYGLLDRLEAPQFHAPVGAGERGKG